MTNRATEILEGAGIAPVPITGDSYDFLLNSDALHSAGMAAALTPLRKWLGFATDAGGKLPESRFFTAILGYGPEGVRSLLDTYYSVLGEDAARASKTFDAVLHVCTLARNRGVIPWEISWKFPTEANCRLLVALPRPLHERLRLVAQEHRLSMSDVVRTGTEEQVARLEAAPRGKTATA